MSESNWSHPCPQYLHRPMQFLFWESDEMAVIMLGFAMGMIIGGWTVWIAAVVGSIAYSHFKKSNPRGFFRHLLYASGLIKIKGYPSYFQDRFFE